MNPFATFALVFGAYLVGCFNSGFYLVLWATGQDIRQVGSGNAGARNASRVLGRSGFVVTFLLDLGKGALVVWIARILPADDRLVFGAAMAVTAGHIWPGQLSFRGGKGLATAVGALFVHDGAVVLTAALVAVILLAILRRSIPSGLLGMASIPGLALAFGRTSDTVLGSAVLSALILFAHRENIVEEFQRLGQRQRLKKSNASVKYADEPTSRHPVQDRDRGTGV